MFETLVAWRYLFQPRFQPRIVAWLFLCLLGAGVGVVLYYETPPGLLALLLAAAPAWFLTAVSGLWTLTHQKDKPGFARAVLSSSGLVSAFFLLLLLGILAHDAFSYSFWLLPILPALALVGLLVVRSRRDPTQEKRGPWISRLLALSVAGFIVVLVNLSVSSVSIQYVGAFLVAGSTLMVVVLFLTCFFSVFTTISITGVILGAASLVMVRAVTRGFGQEFQDKVLGFNAHVLVMKNTYGFTEYPDVLKKVRQIPHVTGAAPFTIAEMIISHEKKSTTVLMKGVDPRRVEEVLDLTTYVQAESRKDLNAVMKRMNENLDKGLVGPGQRGTCQRFDEDGDPIPGAVKKCKLPGIMLGKGLAETLKVQRGSVVRLISPTAEYKKYNNADMGENNSPLARDFRVAGTFYCGFEEYDQKMAFVHLKAAQRFVNPTALPEEENAVLGVEIKLDDVYQAGAVAHAIKEKIGHEDYRIVTWDQLNRPLFEALRTQKLIMTLIVFIMVIVAGFGILAALSMMVINKTREIAVLKAMGASAAGVARVFQFAGVMVGMVGVGCGVGLGILNCHFLSGLNFPLDPKVYLISRLPVLVDWREMITVLAAGLVLCFLSTLYPSHKASSFHPVEGLRYE